LLDHVPVVFNGAHTVMGNWGKLERRFQFLSSAGRFVFYATNNDRWSWKSCVRAYYNGARLADGNAVCPPPEGITVRLHSDPQDEFRLIAVDVKGAWLMARGRNS
jgi:hypothetical protein